MSNEFPWEIASINMRNDYKDDYKWDFKEVKDREKRDMNDGWLPRIVCERNVYSW